MCNAALYCRGKLLAIFCAPSQEFAVNVAKVYRAQANKQAKASGQALCKKSDWRLVCRLP